MSPNNGASGDVDGAGKNKTPRHLYAFDAFWRKLEYPTECSGPPHLLGPWGWPTGVGWSGLLEARASRPPSLK
jgi:hypothetical protein